MIRELLMSILQINWEKNPRALYFTDIMDGVSEGQFYRVLHVLDAICKVKRHHTRLFANNHQDRNQGLVESKSARKSIYIAVATREELLLSAIGAEHPAIIEYVIVPCLRIISQACTPPKPETWIQSRPQLRQPQFHRMNAVRTFLDVSSGLVGGSKSVPELEKNWDGSHKTQDIHLLSYSEWEKGASYLDFPRRQYKESQTLKGVQRCRPQGYVYLALK
ncbi:hypothetical protein POM88_047556 [Heracleum sosnowskyi]|uniref:Uncharacterized protein n=1 Tax=Heracleum sosnowskyi TaxID=360622 RepID=A0AAD8LXP7_9APIA|nr:hypothetical protein POM88_047556 [Heracleum sosnowskyi]